MKNRILILTTTVILLILTGCTPQKNPTPELPTPSEQPVVMPSIPEPVNITYGSAYGLDWSADSQQLSVLGSDKIVKFSASNWQSTGEIPVSGINSSQPFSVEENTIQAVHVSAESYRSNLLSTDISTGNNESDYSIGSETRHTILGLSAEHNLYVMETYRCSAVYDDVPCLIHYDLYTINENKRLFALFEYDQELYESGTVFQYSPDGKYLAAGADDNLIHVWDIEQKKLVFSAMHDSDIYDLDFSSDGRLLLSAGNDGTARIWDIESSTELARLDHLTDGVFFARFLNNDTEILIGLKNGEYTRWQFDRGTQLFSNARPLFSLEPKFYSTLIAPTISISPDEKWIATVDQYHVDIWDLQTGQGFGPLPGFNSFITQIVHSPDGRHLAFRDKKHIYLYETHPFRFVGALPGPEKEYYTMAFRGDQPLLFANAAGQLIVWNYSTGDVATYEEGDENPCLNVQTISSDGKVMISIWKADYYICDVETRSKISYVHNFDMGLDQYAFTADSAGLVDLGSDGARFFSTATGEELYRVSALNEGATFQGDRFLVFPDLGLYDMKTGARQRITAEIEAKDYAALNRNGRLAAVSNGENIELYDLITGKLLQTVADGSLTGLYFNEGDDILYGNHNSGVLKAWDLSALTDPNTYEQIIAPQPTALSVPCSSGEAEATATPEPTSIPTSVPTYIPTIAATQNSADGQTRNEWFYTTVQQLGAPEPVISTWSADEQRVAVATDHQIDIYDVASSQKLTSFPIDFGVFQMSFSSNHSLLAVQITNDRVELWDTATGELVHTFSDLECSIHSIEFSEDDQIVHAECGKRDYFWDRQTGESVEQPADETPTHDLIKWDGLSLRLLNEDGEILRTFEYPNQYPERYEFSKDGTRLFIGFHPYMIARSGAIVNDPYEPAVGQIWDISDQEDPQLLSSITTPYFRTEPYYYIYTPIAQFSPDNRYLIASLDDEMIKSWEVDTGKLVSEFPGTSDFVLSTDGNRLEALDSTGAVSIWDISTPDQPARIWFLADHFSGFPILFTKNGKELIILNSLAYSTREIKNGNISSTQEITYSYGQSYTVTTASPDGRWIARNQAGVISLLDRTKPGATWEEIFNHPNTFRDDYSFLILLAISPDSRWLAAGFRDGKLIYWNLTDRSIHSLENDKWLDQLEISQDGSLLLGANNYGDVVLWDLETGRVINKFELSERNIHLLRPGKNELISIDTDSRGIRIFDISSAKLVRNLDAPDGILSAALLPDGRTLVISGNSGSQMIDLETGEVLGTSDFIARSMTISPDGSMIVAVDPDGQIQVWK